MRLGELLGYATGESWARPGPKELARYDARKKSAIGRRLNTAGSGKAAGVQRKAVGEAFDLVQTRSCNAAACPVAVTTEKFASP
mgnify:CR=1 FL=1